MLMLFHLFSIFIILENNISVIYVHMYVVQGLLGSHDDYQMVLLIKSRLSTGQFITVNGAL